MGLADFWRGYDATLAKVREQRPATVSAVVAILNEFQPPSVGLAFFGNNADDQLALALRDAGWTVWHIEGDYVWEAQSAASSEWLHYVEGDVYAGQYRPPAGPR